MGHGIIFVGGSSNLRENGLYKGSKDNWGMYGSSPKKTRTHKDKSSKINLNVQGYTGGKSNENFNKVSTKVRSSNKRTREKRLFREVRRYASELHSEKVRKFLSRQLYSKYKLCPEKIILDIFNAYFDCYTNVKFTKKNQINNTKQNIENYFKVKDIPLKIQQRFLNGDGMKKLEINDIINCENVVNALHRTFLLNQKIPKKLFKLATDEQVGFSELELTELAELYRIVLQNRDGSGVNRICEKNKFIFLSHNSKVLQTRITEFTKTYSLTDLEKENLPKVKRQKNQGKSTSGIQGYYYNREEYMARKKRERQNKLKNKQQKRKKHRKKKKNLTTKKRKKNKVKSQKNFSIRL